MFRRFGYSFFFVAAEAIVMLLFAPISGFAATDVLTWHNDLARSGLNPREWSLTTGNVNSTDFGKLFLYTLDGQIYAQPLVVSGLYLSRLGHI